MWHLRPLVLFLQTYETWKLGVVFNGSGFHVSVGRSEYAVMFRYPR